MKKVIAMMTAMVMVFVSATLCYGAVKEDNTVGPLYASVAYHSQYFTIDDEGGARYSITVSPLNLDPPDKVIATVTITGPDGGKIYRTVTTLSYSIVSNKFTGSDSFKVGEKGRYEMQVTFKCYGGSTLIETITATPKTASY